MPRQSESLHHSKNYEHPISSRDRYISTNSKKAFQSRVNRFNHSATADEKHLKKSFQHFKVKEKDFNFSHSLFHLNQSGLLFKAAPITTTSRPKKRSAAYISVITFMAAMVAILLTVVIVVPVAVVLYNIKQSSFHSKSSKTTGNQHNGIKQGELFDRINSRAEQSTRRNINRADLLKLNSLTSTGATFHSKSSMAAGNPKNGKITQGELFDRIISRAEQSAQSSKNRAVVLKTNSLTSTEF